MTNYKQQENWRLKLEEYIKKDEAVLVYSPSGYGKSYTARAIAESLGLTVIESNSSINRNTEDLLPLVDRVRSLGLEKCLYLFEEIDGLNDFNTLATIIKNSVYPIVLTCNDLKKIPENVKKLAYLIRAEKPRLDEVVEIVRKVNVGRKVDFRRVTSDIRESLHNTLYNGDTHLSKDDFLEIKGIFEKGKIPEDFDKSYWIWVNDNLPNLYFGTDLVASYDLLCVANSLKTPELLGLLSRRNGKIEFPKYFERLSARYKKKGSGSGSGKTQPLIK